MKALIAVVGAAMLATGAFAQDYVGDNACAGCHQNNPSMGFFDAYVRSGHPWKITRTLGEVPAMDTWPWTPVPPLPVVNQAQLEWSGVEYVIGNFFWKSRFIDRDGFIHTGLADERTQWNLGTEEFVPYHAGEVDKPFDCGRCHTTGYEPEGNQHGLPGLIGTWAQDGVRCEACHGPASEHVDSFGSIPPPGGKDCSECHYRDAEFRMPWSGGFMRHHQQSEDLSHSSHTFLDCTDCHNPHRSVVYNDGGTIRSCNACHDDGTPENGFYRVASMEELRCRDCHMPYMAKSGQNYNEFTGDLRGHLFQITTEPIMAAENVTDGFWNQDGNGDAFVTLDYACLGCHVDFSDLTIQEAAAYAADIHTRFPAKAGDVDYDGEVSMADLVNLLIHWGPCDPTLSTGCRGDVNNDSMVDFDDIDLVFEFWGS